MSYQSVVPREVRRKEKEELTQWEEYRREITLRLQEHRLEASQACLRPEGLLRILPECLADQHRSQPIQRAAGRSQ